MKKKDLGFKIKKLREEKEMSQQELADCLEISQSKLSKIENSRIQKIEVSLILKLCECFQVEIDYFAM